MDSLHTLADATQFDERARIARWADRKAAESRANYDIEHNRLAVAVVGNGTDCVADCEERPYGPGHALSCQYYRSQEILGKYPPRVLRGGVGR